MLRPSGCRYLPRFRELALRLPSGSSRHAMAVEASLWPTAAMSSIWTERVRYFATYDVTGEDGWFSLNLDPDGVHFWAGSRDNRKCLSTIMELSSTPTS